MPHAADFTDSELTAYIAEELPVGRSAAVEAAIRSSEALQARLARLIAAQDDSPQSVGDFWRRRRIACPARSTWQAYLDNQIGGEFREYLRFHLEDIGCRYCNANLDDLRATADPAAAGRVRKFFATSVGRLKDLPLADEV